MSTPRLFTFLTPGFYSDPYPLRYITESAKRFSIPLNIYGFCEPYKDWYDVQITRLLTEIEHAPTSHIFYTDGSDALFLGDEGEIEARYDLLERPDLLMSVESDFQICAGGWLAEKKTALGCLTILRDMQTDESNPQERWRRAIDPAMGVNSDHCVLPFFADEERDLEGEIFAVTGRPFEFCNVGHRRIYLPDSGTYPSILHFAGGYTDPVVGKAALIDPVWKELGYGIVTPSQR